MRELPAELAAHLAGGITSLCRCWRLVRRDGAVMGFTDHDRDISFGGTVFRANTGLEAAEATQELGFAVSGGEVAGALVSDGIAEKDVDSGLYDDAGVEIWLVNWQEPQQRFLMDLFNIGEIRRADGAFIVELRGMAHRLDEDRGRLYRAACSADLGDAACGLTITATEGVITQTDGALTMTAEAFTALPENWFTGGAVSFIDGENTGFKVEIRAHRAEGLLELWQRAPQTIAVGDRVAATPGCDKSFRTCREKFANTVNFRGFPHMPGNDFILRVPQQGEPGLDGGSLFR